MKNYIKGYNIYLFLKIVKYNLYKDLNYYYY